MHEMEVRTCASRYRVRAILAGADTSEATRPVIVLLHLLVRRPFGQSELRDRFHFTPREMQVSRLLATGCSTAALANVLEISVHTARRHLEHVLSKLGVHSRGAAAAMLRMD
jgi:DNA-binding CsgD family transcriptional regulator